MDKVNIMEHFSQLQESCRERIVGEVNGSAIKLEKLRGEFAWQQHDDRDELLFVVKGRLLMMYHERNIWVEAGELIVVPKGVAYKLYVPNGECHVVAVEPHVLPAQLPCCS